MSIRFGTSTDNFFRDTNLPPITSFTIMAWVRWLSLDGSWDGVINFGVNTTSSYYFMGISPDLSNRFTLVSPVGVVADGGVVPIPGQWYHLCMTVAGTSTGQFLGYVNGINTMTADGNGVPTAGRLSIGNNPDSDWLNGDIFAVKIWNRVLTATEIQLEMWDVTPVSYEAINSFAPLWNAQDATSEYAFGRQFSTAGAPASIIDNPFGVRWSRTRRKIYLPNDQAASSGSSQLGAFSIGGTYHMSPNAAAARQSSYRVDSSSNISEQGAANHAGIFVGTMNSHLGATATNTVSSARINMAGSADSYMGGSLNKLGSTLLEGDSHVASFARRLIMGSVETGDAVYTEGLVAVDRLGIFLIEGDSDVTNAAAISSRGTLLFPSNADLYVNSAASVSELGAFELLGRADLSMIASVLSRGGISLAGMSDLGIRGAAQKMGRISQDGSSILYANYASASAELGDFILNGNSNVVFQAAVLSRGGFSPAGMADLYSSATPNISELGAWTLENSSFLGMSAAVSKGGIFVPDGRSDLYFSSLSAISELGAIELFGGSHFAARAAVTKGGNILAEGSSHSNWRGAMLLRGRIITIDGNSYLLFDSESPPVVYPDFVPLKIVYLTLRV